MEKNIMIPYGDMVQNYYRNLAKKAVKAIKNLKFYGKSHKPKK